MAVVWRGKPGSEEGVDSMGEEYTLDYTVCSGLTGLDSTVTHR